MKIFKQKSAGQGRAEGPRPPALSPRASVGRRWRFRRNLVILVANRNGISQRILADVFDLYPSRIASILKEFSAADAAT